MDGKALFEELKQKANEFHKYLKAHPEEADTVPSWMFTSLSAENTFLLQGCSKVRHEAELTMELTERLVKDNFIGFLLLAAAVVSKLLQNEQQKIEGASRWVN